MNKQVLIDVQLQGGTDVRFYYVISFEEHTRTFTSKIESMVLPIVPIPWLL
jgi:hypothetical protein